MSVGMFTEEIVNSWSEKGIVETTATAEEIRRHVLDAIGRTVRFNGMCAFNYTVLDHSWLTGAVSQDLAHVDCVPMKIQYEAGLCGMLHDIGETVVGDMIWPLKNRKYKQIYDGSYLCLETAFRSFAAVKAFGVDDFDGMMNRVEKYVREADRLCGQMEMLGVSTSGDFITHGLLESVFRNVHDGINSDKFCSAVDGFMNKIKNCIELDKE